MKAHSVSTSDTAPFSPIPAIVSVILIVAAFAALPPGGVPAAVGGGGSSWLLILEGGLADAGATRDAIREAGGRPLHVFPPDAAVAWLPDGAADALGARWPGLATYAEGDAPPLSDALAPAARCAVAYWAARDEAPEAKSSDDPHAGAPHAADPADHVFVRPMPAGKGAPTPAASGGPPGAGFWDLSEFMLGDVSVSILAPESDGSVDPSTENWTVARYDKVATEAIAALDWWLARAGSLPLSFTVRIAQPATAYEPIVHPQSEEGIWIGDVMEGLGHSTGDYFERVANYSNALRDTDGTDWAVCVFVADSWNDADGRFADGFFGYAYLGGPFLVMTYDNNGWSADNMDAVLAHEMGHSFYALDEYASAGVACTERAGYLNAENGNSALPGCPKNVTTCIMRSVVLSTAVADSFTTGQIGWWDADADGLPNILDTSADATLDPYTPTPGDPYHATLTGVADENPLPNGNPYGYAPTITMNTVTLVEWRVDGGAWGPASPVDGAWDEIQEDFTFTTGTLSSGSHLVETRAMNTAGNYGPLDSETVVIDATSVEPPAGGLGGPLATRLGVAVPNPARAESEIFWTLGAATEVSLTIHDTSGRRVRSLVSGALGVGAHSAVWDGRDDQGRAVASGVYLYRLVTKDHDDSKRLSLVR